MNSSLEIESPGEWIDAHVHLWTSDLQSYPIDDRYSVDEMQPRSFTSDDLFAHCRPSGVGRVVLIQMMFYECDNSYMLDAISQSPTVFSGVGMVDHRLPSVAREMQALAGRGVRGFRIHARGDDAQNWVSDAGMNALWQTAGEEGLAVCPLVNPRDIPFIDQLCAKHAAVTVVLDHFARLGVDGPVQREPLKELCRLSRYPNVYVKTSAFYAVSSGSPYHDTLPTIRKLIDAFGPERLMWASDCPYQVQDGHTYDDSIAVLRDQTDRFSETERDWMLRGTAEKVFF